MRPIFKYVEITLAGEPLRAFVDYFERFGALPSIDSDLYHLMDMLGEQQRQEAFSLMQAAVGLPYAASEELTQSERRCYASDRGQVCR